MNTTPEAPKADFGTIKEVGTYLRVSRSTINRLFDLRKLPKVKIGGAVRIPWKSVHALVEEK